MTEYTMGQTDTPGVWRREDPRGQGSNAEPVHELLPGPLCVRPTHGRGPDQATVRL